MDLTIDPDRVEICGQIVTRPSSIAPSTWIEWWQTAQDPESQARAEARFALRTDGVCPTCGADAYAETPFCNECGEPCR